ERDPFKRGKRILRLMRNKGVFVKPCPGTKEYVCCGLLIIHIGQGCPMDCRYCALQAYFNRPVLEVFVNIEEMLAGVESHIRAHPGRFHRFCTGEFTDSLALDHITGMTSRLVKLVSGFSNASLEIKTKTTAVDHLLDLNPRGRIILSFSVNAERVSVRDEIRAASIGDRVLAAARAERHGYRLGFHFDPIIPFHGWEQEYYRTIDTIFANVNPSKVAWISLGVLRFVPDLKQIALTRFGPVDYFHDGFIRGLDGKSRLPVTRRIEIYRRLADRIRAHAPQTIIYLCMESPHVWQESLDMIMESNEQLAALLDVGAAGR
ncbi:MAG: radical SAM protein, partial [Pseudomonadota bacterium]